MNNTKCFCCCTDIIILTCIKKKVWERYYLPPTTPLITGITRSNTSTAIIVNRTAPLLMNAVHALDRVVLVMAEQSATVLMLLNNVIAIKPTNTMTAMLIIVLTSTITILPYRGLLRKHFHFRRLFVQTHISFNKPVSHIYYSHPDKHRNKCR